MENPAFETVEDIDRVEHKHEYERKSAVQAFEEPEEPEEPKCQFLGFLPIPKICQKWFLTAPWILVFLSFASTIQVRFFCEWHSHELYST